MTFNQGLAPTIAYVNYAKTPLGVDLGNLVAASQKFIDTIFSPIWGAPAKLIRAEALPAGAWLMGFFDTADEAGALGYHDLSKDGLPVSKVFVKDTLKNGQPVKQVVQVFTGRIVQTQYNNADNCLQRLVESPDGTQSKWFNDDQIELDAEQQAKDDEA